MSKWLSESGDLAKGGEMTLAPFLALLGALKCV